MSEIYKEKPLVKVIMLKGADGTGTKLSEFENDVTFLTEQQIITLVTNIVESGSVGDIDTGFVTTVKEQNNDRGLKFWVGTQEEYDAIVEHDTYTFYIITDGTSEDIDAKLAALKAELEEEIQEEVATVDQTAEVASLTNEVDSLWTQLFQLANREVGDKADTDAKISNLSNTLCYKSGDTDTAFSVVTGYISSNRTGIYFTVPLPKTIPSNRGISVNGNDSYLKIVLRQNGNYVLGTADSPVDVSAQTQTVRNYGSYLYIEVKFREAISGSVNNEVCAIDCDMAFEIL